MENKDIFDPDLKDVTGFLRNQAAVCHDMAQDLRAVFYKETNRAAQESSLHLMLKLMAATAAAAAAMGRLKSTQTQQVLAAARARKSENSDSAKTNSGSPA
ncbi:MAG: hypothetical protein JSR55_14115 [Proteobacteria bacterium]|nr:hypothetical protein [Pseudomonadota bacterium]